MPPKRSDLELAAKEMTEATHASSYLSHVLKQKPQRSEQKTTSETSANGKSNNTGENLTVS